MPSQIQTGVSQTPVNLIYADVVRMRLWPCKEPFPLEWETKYVHLLGLEMEVFFFLLAHRALSPIISRCLAYELHYL